MAFDPALKFGGSLYSSGKLQCAAVQGFCIDAQICKKMLFKRVPLDCKWMRRRTRDELLRDWVEGQLLGHAAMFRVVFHLALSVFDEEMIVRTVSKVLKKAGNCSEILRNSVAQSEIFTKSR